MLGNLKCKQCGTRIFADPRHKGTPCPHCHKFDDFEILEGPILPDGRFERIESETEN